VAFFDVAWDGAAPLTLVLRAAGHPPGLYVPHVALRVDAPAQGGAEVVLSWADFGARQASGYVALVDEGPQAVAFVGAEVFYSDGTSPVALVLSPAGAAAAGRVRAVAARVG